MAAYEYINLSGVVVADTEDTKTEVQNEYKQVFGDDLDLSDETPQGALIASETIARNGVAVNNANLANQINPNYAGGIFLDAIMALSAAITGGRQEAQSSTFSVPVDLTGVPGTIIPEGSIALSVNGDEFESLGEVTLSGGGTASVGFQSVEKGAISCGIGDLNSLGPNAPLGWETVNNTVAATLGRSEETDPALRLRRRDALAEQGISVAEAITSAISALDGTTKPAYLENVESTPEVIEGINLVPHSIYVCVSGGLDSEIASALLENKTPGAAWNGNTTVTTIEPFSGQSYDVKFERPAVIDAWVRVTISPTTVSNPSAVIDDAVLAYANGELRGERGFIVGADVSPFEIASAINISEPEIFVENVELSIDGNAYSSVPIVIGLDEIAATDASKITTVVS